jgi:hypothetical protein
VTREFTHRETVFEGLGQRILRVGERAEAFA